MITVDGKQVFTELSELVDPSHTALSLIDMQHDFVDPDGAFGEMGVDVSMYHAQRPVLAALLDDARNAGVLVIHVQNTALPNRMSDSPAQIRFNLRMHAAHRGNDPALRYSVPGTPGHAFVRAVTPRPDERVVLKNPPMCFRGITLHLH